MNRFTVDDQSEILLDDGKINFENASYSFLLKKIDKHMPREQLFKSTQGIVENPSCLNKKNIATIENAGYDVSDFFPGQSVFVIPKDEIESLHLTSDEQQYLREYHEPNEINRYYCQNTFKNYLLYITRETMKSIDEYPSIKNHLTRFKPFMEQRRETQKGTVKWFQLHWPRKESLFLGEKVVYPQMGAVPTFAYSNKPFFTNMSANIVYAIPGSKISIKVLTCILNSEMAHFWLLHRAKNRGIGLDIAVSVIDKFPADSMILTDSILLECAEEVIRKAISQEDFSEVEDKINERIYLLYDIDEEEQSTIKAYIQERVHD